MCVFTAKGFLFFFEKKNLLAVSAVLSSLTIKQFSFCFFSQGIWLGHWNAADLCRALRVHFIHNLFQRSSLEEEMELFGDSLPANSQIRLF